MTSTREGWGPEGRRAAVSVTFDNLGEARDVGEGTWPVDRAHGRHPSALRALPAILRMLGGLGVRASFYVEGWNADVYPDQLRAIVEGGHDLGLHGWVHEAWAGLSPGEEVALLDRSIEAAARQRLAFAGFRPPGGVLAAPTLALLRERGLQYCSPLGEAVSLSDGVAVLPFEWQAGDGYHYLEELALLRRSNGDPVEVATPARCAAALRRALAAVVDGGGYTALTFHPFLMLDPAAGVVAEQLIRDVAADERIWCAPSSEVAAWVTDHAGAFAGEPALGTARWR